MPILGTDIRTTVEPLDKGHYGAKTILSLVERSSLSRELSSKKITELILLHLRSGVAVSSLTLAPMTQAEKQSLSDSRMFSI